MSVTRSYAASGSHDHQVGQTYSPSSPSSIPDTTLAGDWVKSENGLYFNAKEIEDNARAMCGSLIADCIVVGTGRSSPVMFIEPGVDSVGTNEDRLKKDIFRKIRHFHSRRYLHEQILSPDMIVIVPESILPAVKGDMNIRRKAVEEAFRSQIDEIFARRW